MKKRSSQSGSAHLIIIIVLVVALVGTLGFIFWQNFGQPKQATTSTPSASTANPVTDTRKTASMSDLYKLEFKYPQNWTIQRSQTNIPKTSDDSSSDAYILVSPDKKYKLNLTLTTPGGYGGACDPTQASSLYAYRSVNLDGWPGKSFAQYIYTDAPSGKWFADGIITLTSNLKNISSASNSCDVAFIGITPTGDSDDLDGFRFTASIHISDTTSGYVVPNFSTQAEAQAFIDSQNFKDIKDILLSIVAA